MKAVNHNPPPRRPLVKVVELPVKVVELHQVIRMKAEAKTVAREFRLNHLLLSLRY